MQGFLYSYSKILAFNITVRCTLVTHVNH